LEWSEKELKKLKRYVELAVQLNMRQTGNNRMQAIYAIHDELVEQDIEDLKKPLPCKKGCSHCCQILVDITPSEWENITQYLLVNPKLLEHVRNSILPMQKAWFKALEILSKANQSNFIDKAALLYFGTKCCFLKDGICTIYPIRPFNCRSHFTQEQCQSTKLETPVYFIWKDLLEKLIPDISGATPLPVFLYRLLHL
jgi:Fe-S-cluster containining protein